MVTITLNSDELSEKIGALQQTMDPEKLLPALEVKLREVVEQNLTDNYATKPNKLGGESTLYWTKVIGSIETEIVDEGVVLDMSEKGLALHFYGSGGLPGGVVVPKNTSEITGKKITRLSIPVIAAAHGKTIAQVPGLELGKFPKGFGLGKDDTLWFILVKSVKIKPDPKILPLDLGETLTVWFTQQLPDV